MNRIERLMEQIEQDKPAFIPRKKMQKIFKGRLHEWIYFQKLCNLYKYYYEQDQLENDSFYYPTKKAIEDLNMSEKQITKCRNNLQKEGWIFIQQKSLDGTVRWWIQINQDKLFNAYNEDVVKKVQTPVHSIFRVVNK